MKKVRTASKIIPFAIGMVAIAAFVGSISGSLAWWAYSTRVSASYQGTSVSTSEQLQIGLKLVNFTDSEVDELIDLGLEEDTLLASGNTRYVFAKAGGGLPAATIGTYLQSEGHYAYDELMPITSREFRNGPITYDAYRVEDENKVKMMTSTWSDIAEVSTLPDNPNVDDAYFYNNKVNIWDGEIWVEKDLSGSVSTASELPAGSTLNLYETLMSGSQVNTTPALTTKYLKIPFVFRILKLNSVGTDDKYADGRDIYLSKVNVEATSANPDSKVADSLRLFFNNGTESNKIIVNPGDVETTNVADMKTYVAGALDLDNDQVYDYINGKELIYGDWTGTPSNEFLPSSEPTQLSNINNVQGIDDLSLIDENHNTFLSTHGMGHTCYTDYAGINRGYAEYRTLASIKPNDSKAKLSGGVPLCTTSASSGNYLAELETTIWLEGWDHAVVDKAISHKFNLSMQFQIDLIN